MAKLKSLNLIILLLISSVVLSASKKKIPKPIFSLSMNGELLAKGKLVPAEIKTTGEISYLPGVKKQGLVIGNGAVSCQFENPLKFPEGTISIWFKPGNWQDFAYLEFLNTYQVPERKGQRILRLYIPGHYRISFSVLRYFDKKKRSQIFCHRTLFNGLLKKSTWHLAVFRWKNSKGEIYIDGFQITADPNIGKDLDLGNTLVIGGQTRTKDGKPITTVIDNFSIYNRALSEEQIRGLYERFMGSMIAKDNF